MTIKELVKEIHENAVAHGWWDEERSFGDIIALCHSELSEALEEYRDGKSDFYFEKKDKISAAFGEQDYYTCTNLKYWKDEKPEGIGVELADCVIRIFDYCGKAGIDIASIIEVKHEYNKTRPYRHGGKKL